MPRAEDGRLIGSRLPRLHTPELRPLTPETSRGFALIEFADLIGVPLLPWQQELAIRLLEEKAPGEPRFKTAVVLVGRQSGKTTFCKVLALFKMYVEGARLVVGAAQSLDISREAWSGAVELAQAHPELTAEVANVRRANGEQCLTLVNGARYRITATTAGAGRGLSTDLLILDEVRQQRDWAAWSSLSKTTIARAGSQIVCISNAGDDESVVLNSLRESALSGKDETLGLFEWSAEDGCDIADPEAWAQGAPGIGHIVDEASIRSALATDPPAVFRTEVLCQRVIAMDSAIDLAAWESCADRSMTMEPVLSRLAACIDVASDGRHVALVAAGVGDDGRVRVKPVSAWPSTAEARRELPGLLERLKPKVFGWFPGGPAAAIAADLRGLEAVELKGSAVAEACQELAEQVAALQVVHDEDPLLTKHVVSAQKLHSGDGWRFVRAREGEHVDAAYAAAGAVHLARTLPEEPPAWAGPLVL